MSYSYGVGISGADEYTDTSATFYIVARDRNGYLRPAGMFIYYVICFFVLTLKLRR